MVALMEERHFRCLSHAAGFKLPWLPRTLMGDTTNYKGSKHKTETFTDQIRVCLRGTL
jgi:hypothetical protein